MRVFVISVGQFVPDRHGGTGAFAADHVPIEFNFDGVSRRVIGCIDDIRRADGGSIPHDLIRVAVTQGRHEFNLGENLLVLIIRLQFVVDV
ncbi:hypothetical protein D3C86_1428360 [compost metagenome]